MTELKHSNHCCPTYAISIIYHNEHQAFKLKPWSAKAKAKHSKAKASSTKAHSKAKTNMS